MTFYSHQDETAEWLNYLQPEGLVVGPNVLRERGVTPIRQSPLDTETAAEALLLDAEAARDQDRLFELHDPWKFFEQVLGWPAKLVAGSPGGPAVDPSLTVTVPEHETLLAPHMALLWNGNAPEGIPAQALVMLCPALEVDGRNQFSAGEWEATPHQRLERLLRETNVGVGIIVARNTLRLVYVPRGETAGWLSWPLAALGRVEGRPMLAGLKLCLGRNAFFTGSSETRLRKLLEASREAQNAVSEKLSGQVLGALYELLRGLHRAAPQEIEAIADSDPHHLYEGLLACLMRLVFLLYAEDRDLLPSSSDPHLKQLWENGYSIKTLYARLLVDEALNPDTMDERRGGWGQLLAVFRLIHRGHRDWVIGRGGKLFDPDGFPFLEGRETGSVRAGAKVLPVSDGTILRILHGLMTVEGRSLSGEKIRERLSYRSLDVESIGSVYETVMGFTASRAQQPMIALRDEKKLPNFIGLDTILAQKPNDRQKWLKDNGVKLTKTQADGLKLANDISGLIDAFGSLVDERASPKATPIGRGAPYLQPTEERRRTGSHYTPRSLTEPIVRHALELAFSRLGEQASPEAVLSLKVLDPACGSGAFLVEACRQLGARLEQAWNTYGAEKPKIPADEDEALHARRLVAQKCLYGVDKNPLAVDLARLSLWLVTLAKDHEFTFLDHALKSGDSLVGLTRAEIVAAHWDAAKPGLPLFRETIKQGIERACEGREAIRNASDDVRLDAQAARFQRVQDQIEPARIIGDAVVAAFFAADKPGAREEERQKVENWITGAISPDWKKLEAKGTAFRADVGWRPFHWEVEFPEVFANHNPGFDAIVGNPPFLGGAKIWSALGHQYPDWLRSIHVESGGKAVDLIAHFFRRAFNLLRSGGTLGLIATKTVSEGDTRLAGLLYLCTHDAQIYFAKRNFAWPGAASVVISAICLEKGSSAIQRTINGKTVSSINSKLMAGIEALPPHQLANGGAKSFRGADTYGLGFVFSDDVNGEYAGTLEQARLLIEKSERNSEIIRPYIGGDEIASHPTHAFSRYAINFRNLSLAEAARWSELLEIVRAKVFPKRQKLGGYGVAERRKKFWWQYGTDTPALRNATQGHDKVIAISQTTAHISFAVLPAHYIFSQKAIVIVGRNVPALFSILQSRFHMLWALYWGSRQGDTPVYSPADCFETFPLPLGYETNAALEAAGHMYQDHRAALMVAANEGMTRTYNRFHDPEESGRGIQTLREMQDQMDQAVLKAYRWEDLAAQLRPEFLSDENEDDHSYRDRYFWPADARDRVLARLVALNTERHNKEFVEGVAPAKRPQTDVDEEKDGPHLDFD